MRSDSRARWSALGTFTEVGLLWAAVLAFGLLSQWFGWFTTVDRWTFDSLTRTFAAARHDAVVIVGIDQQSLSRFGRWPWPRDRQAQLIDRIRAAGAADLIIDVVYADPSDPMADRRLADAMARTDSVSVPLVIDSVHQGGQLIELLPIPAIAAVVDHIGHVHTEIEPDGIVRGVYFYQGIDDAAWSHLVAAAVSRHGGELPAREAACVSTGISLQNVRCAFEYVPFVGPPGSISQVSAVDVIDHANVAALLRDKIVLLGVTATGVADWVTTPVSGATRPMAGVEFNANLLNGYLTRAVRHPAPAWLPFLLVVLTASGAALWLPRAKPNKMIGVTLLCALAPLALATIAFTAARTILPPWSATLAAALAYPLWSWRRLAHAWRFLTAEIEQLVMERKQLIPGHPLPDLDATMAFLSRILECEVGVQPTGLDADDSSAPTTAAFTVALPLQSVRLVRREHAFTPAEVSLAHNALAPHSTPPTPPAQAPIERLAAQIEVLESMADEVQKARRLGQQTLEGTTSGICVADATGRVLAVNSAFARLTSGTPVHLMATNVLDVLAEIPTAMGLSWSEIIHDTLLSGRTITYEVPLRSAPALVTCAPLPIDEHASSADSAGESGLVPTSIFMITVADLSEVHAARTQRAEALAFLSHDLRSPIVSILALVRGGARTADPALLTRIESYARRSLNTSDQFLQLSRIESQEAFERYDLDLAAVIQNAIDQVFETANERRITVELIEEFAPGEGLWMRGNGELLERTFVNLLSNAIKFSPPGSRVRVVASATDDRYRCAVIDEGRGIAAGHLGRIFDPFFRVQRGDGDPQHGAGLGLRFVKTVVERHGGNIHVASELGRGSRFTVELPRDANC